MQSNPALERATLRDVPASPAPAALPSNSTATWLFPGLGCRYVGMGHDLLGRCAAADRLVEAAQAYLNYDIAEICLAGSGRKYVSPRHEAQVIYVLDCAYAAVLKELGFTPHVVAGHSLGSLAAGTVCGAYDFLTGLKLVSSVEDLMEELVEGRDQAMGVVIGLDQPAINKLLSQTSGVHLANWNSPLQHVVGGSVAGVERLLATATTLGAKQAKRFGFGRAMHTPCVAEVATRFRETLASIHWTEPTVPFANSHDATVLRTAAEIQHFLGVFLSLPVHWQATIQAVQQGWGNQFVEVGPGSLLTSMLPFIDSTATIRTASELLDRRVLS